MTISIAMPLQARPTLDASGDVAFKIEPLRDECECHPPCSFNLIEALAEVLCDPRQRLSGNTSIKHGEDHVEATEVDALNLELKWSGIHLLLRKDSPLSSGADIAASPRDPAKQDAIFHHGLPPRR